MKKNLITLVFLTYGSLSFANYNIVINTNLNDYEIVEKLNEIEYTNWVLISSSCSKDKLEDDFYFGVNFKQLESCEKNYERTKNTYKIYSDGNKVLISSEKETNKEIETSEKDLIGIHLESTCKDILLAESGKYNSGDGLYHLAQQGTPEVYCDMTRNGGGWMRVANYDWYQDSSNIPNSGFDSTKNKSIVDTTNRSYPIVDAFWVKDWTVSATPTSQRWKSIDVTPIYEWSESMIDFEGWAFRSLDGFHPAKSLSSNLDGQYMDGFSFSYLKNGVRNHLYSIPVGYENDSDGRALLTWLPNSEYTYFPMGVHEPGWTFNRKVSKDGNNAIVTKSKTKGKDSISLRFMADQYYNDESIGFRKYIIWVK
jgi:hypothetical protein